MKVVSYFQGVGAELRKVTWPTLPAVVRSFLAVVIGTVIAAAIIGGLDYVFLKLLGLILK